MLALLRAVEDIPAPALLTVTAADHWARYVTDPAVFDGGALVHRDMNPCNFVVSDERAWLVDWGWAVRGPAWLTAGEFVLSLMEAEWTPGAAEQVAAELPAWQAADPRDIDVFARERRHVG